MPEIPLAGFVLEALGAMALALMLSSFERKRPRAGIRDWSLGLWLLAAALLASVAVSRVPHSPLRTLLLALAMVLAYWSPALVLLGTWSRWNDREVPAGGDGCYRTRPLGCRHYLCRAADRGLGPDRRAGTAPS
jgi:hypothetical protein